MRNGVIEATVDMDQVNNVVLDMTGHESLDCNTLDFLLIIFQIVAVSTLLSSRYTQSKSG